MHNKIFLLLLMLLPITMWAQSYTVYSVVGSAKVQNGNTMVPLKPRKVVNAQTRIAIADESAVTVIDEKNAKMFSFTTRGTHTIGQLVGTAKGGGKNLSRQYMSYLVKQMFGDGSQKMSHPDTYMNATATAYRSTSSDSLLINKMRELLAGDLQKRLEPQLLDATKPVMTDYDVQFELVDCETGVPVGNDITPGTSCYVRVSNHTPEMLYMNVLDIDANGNKYLVLPMDEASTCAHLLVPPSSTVSFKSEPFIFGDEPSKETFLLMATPNPVDFSIVMGPLHAAGSQVMQTGLQRRFYQVGQTNK